MKPGGGQAKGGSFERLVSKGLSMWCSGNTRDDLFWRSAGSGSRGTTQGVANQLGDVGAISAEGAPLTTACVIECKCYNTFDWARFIFDGKGNLDGFWLDLQLICLEHKRMPLLVGKENRRATVVILPASALLRAYAQPVLVLYRATGSDIAVVRWNDFILQPYSDWVARASIVASSLYAPPADKRPASNSTRRARLQIGVPQLDRKDGN